MKQFYKISVNLGTVDKDSTYISSRGAKDRLQSIISDMGIDESEYEMIGSMCYDDYSINFKNKFTAVMVAAKLDSILGEAPREYRLDYDIAHNAMVTGPWITTEDDEEVEDNSSRVIYRG